MNNTLTAKATPWDTITVRGSERQAMRCVARRVVATGDWLQA